MIFIDCSKQSAECVVFRVNKSYMKNLLRNAEAVHPFPPQWILQLWVIWGGGPLPCDLVSPSLFLDLCLFLDLERTWFFLAPQVKYLILQPKSQQAHCYIIKPSLNKEKNLFFEMLYKLNLTSTCNWLSFFRNSVVSSPEESLLWRSSSVSSSSFWAWEKLTVKRETSSKH